MRKIVFCLFAVSLSLSFAPWALAQAATDEYQKDQTFEAIMASVRPSQPQASGFAKIILPSPRFWPLNRFAYVRVEADGLIPGKSHNIHLHTTRTDAQGVLNTGCFANGGVVVNLRSLVGDANGHGLSVTRIILDENYRAVVDANGNINNPVTFTRATLTRWYVQFHVPAGMDEAGLPMGCGEMTLSGFDRGQPYQ